MEIAEIEPENNNNWDSIIENYDSKKPFHNLAWLDYLEKTQGGRKRFFEIKNNDQIIGYFCGLEIEKGPFKIFGSPLQGWNTPEMGLIINNSINQESIIEAIGNYFKEKKFSALEFSNNFLNNEIMGVQKFSCYKRYTSVIDLSLLDVEGLWNNISGKARNHIKQARKNNLTVELVNNNIADFIVEYYRQLKGVFGRRRLAIPYKKDRIEKLFGALKEKDMLIALTVKNKEKEIIATALLINDKRYIFMFGLTNRIQYLYLSPNDFLIWSSIEIAKEKNIKIYDLGGLGNLGIDTFKNKFGGTKKEIVHWYKFYNPQAKIAYFVYKALMLFKLHILKWSL